jgi:MarR family transcriptional regulator, transcriptional regulator for hemolysin
MVDGERIYDAWVALHQAAIVLERAVDVRLRPWNLSGSQVGALSVLAEHGPQRMSDLARYLLQQTQTTTDLVDRLEQRGLVQRIRHSTDRRVVLVEATQAARDLLEQIDGTGWVVGREAIGALSDADVRQLTETARRIRNRAAEMGNVPAEHLSYAEERLRIVPVFSEAMAAD